MSQFTIDLDEPDDEVTTVETSLPESVSEPVPVKRRGSWLKRIGVALLILAVVGAAGGFFYWQRLKSTPQYSLALLVDAARRDDQEQMDRLVDTDSVVDSFLPQVIGKAVELYGKNTPPQAVNALTAMADKFKPAIKRRAREEVPRVIREKTDKFERVPYWAIAIGAGWFLDIRIEGENATVTSKIENRPFELTLKRNGDVWRVVGIKDEVVAKRIAEAIGQEMIRLASQDGITKAAEKLGLGNVDEIRKKIEGLIFK